MDENVKILAKELREDYKPIFKYERYWALTSTKSATKGILTLSCYPQTVMDRVLVDKRFNSFIIENNLEYKTKAIVKTGMFRINLTEIKSVNPELRLEEMLCSII